MRVHFLGICGSFMAGLAVIAKQMGHKVTGQDALCYPPMSDVLAQAAIKVQIGYNDHSLLKQADCVVVGNVLSRGNPAVEALLNSTIAYTSGPQWLAEQVLVNKHVLAVAGTHGKTTTSALLAWMLSCAQLEPGYLIGGAVRDFSSSAHYSQSPYFVIEADEYDTAFFDKRPKFMHYRPSTLIMNNLEFDHADIYPDLASIQTQCHYLLRTVPAKGRVIYRADDRHLQAVLSRGIYSELSSFALSDADIHAVNCAADGSAFDLYAKQNFLGRVNWSLLGLYNVHNALAATAAALAIGIDSGDIISALERFSGVEKRLQKIYVANDVHVYLDFAHHPTAIAAVIETLRAHHPQSRLRVVLQCGSRTMQRHVNLDQLATALNVADQSYLFHSDELQWQPQQLARQLKTPLISLNDCEQLQHAVCADIQAQDVIVVMSNKHFSNMATAIAKQLHASFQLST